MPTLTDYIRHADEYGGLRECWEVAWDELNPIDLGELAEALSARAARRRRVGRKGRTVSVESFSLTREETDSLIERLIAVGVGDLEVCRYARVSQAKVGAARAERGSDPHKSAEMDPAQQGVIRNQIQPSTHRPSTSVQALRSPDSRTCEWCSAALPSTLRADARYCMGGCREAAYRARRAA